MHVNMHSMRSGVNHFGRSVAICIARVLAGVRLLVGDYTTMMLATLPVETT